MKDIKEKAHTVIGCLLISFVRYVGGKYLPSDFDGADMTTLRRCSVRIFAV